MAKLAGDNQAIERNGYGLVDFATHDIGGLNATVGFLAVEVTEDCQNRARNGRRGALLALRGLLSLGEEELLDSGDFIVNLFFESFRLLKSEFRASAEVFFLESAQLCHTIEELSVVHLVPVFLGSRLPFMSIFLVLFMKLL